jgi:hypothetical protein
MTPRFTKEFDTYIDADAWLTAGDYRESALVIRDSGETLVTLEGEFASRAYDAENGPLAPGGFRLREVETIG